MLLKDMIYGILSVREKMLKRNLSRTIGIKNKSKSKRYFSRGCVLDLNTMAETEKQNLESELNLILKQYDYEPEKLLEYVKKYTKVFYSEKAAELLNAIGENEGFIYPARGAKALYLSLCVSGKPALKTDEMFVMKKGEINKYLFIYHFYNWYAFRHNIAGMDTKSQELLKKFLFDDSDMKNLQLEDIYNLKDAIKQDRASIEFVIKLCRNYDGVKQAVEKIKKEGARI